MLQNCPFQISGVLSSCDIDNVSNDDENSALHHMNTINFKIFIKIENIHIYCCHWTWL